tara:strand:+ start:496 stop:1269 length:774 start_codon:yes stop_codon:yes gene_type:complete
MGLVAISKTDHMDKALSGNRNYSFAKDRIVVPICEFELIMMAATTPLLFMRSNASVQLYGLLGLQTGKNLFVKPDGSWSARFKPAILSCHPFSLGKLDDGRHTIVFDEDSEFIVDRDQGYPFFEEDGSVGGVINHYTKLLSDITHSLPRVKEACSLLDDFGLLMPFDHAIKKKDGGVVRLDGLLAVNKEKFLKLKESEFLKLRDTCAINLVYAHYFSQVNFHSLMDSMNAYDRASSSLKEIGLNIFQGKDEGLDFNF